MAEKKKPVQKAGLHKFVATGGQPKDYEGSVENNNSNPKEKVNK